ncbi:MAG: hydrogenase 4 subunit B, partial [Alphaproteobacteria bacterium]|nr:hydrogenase 4 subunit B [Alphaproteobacteria bacterium]
FDLMGDPGWGWGAVLLVVGAASALYGILSALLEDDIKTILACSTIENVGIVMIGLGLALVFRFNGLASLAALSAGAALLHVFNHALMKTLMFCVAGAVQTATGTRSLERLGGLIHRLPVTATLALAGAAAISALPPFNGFISEWLTFQAVLGSSLLPQWTLRFGVPVVGAVMALAAALAAACFVRVFGIAFLGRPRTAEAAEAMDVDPWMRGAMAGLAALCLAVGVLPRAVVVPLGLVVASVVKAPLPSAVNGAGLEGWLWLTPLEPSQSSYSGLVVLLAAVIVTVAGAAGVHRLANNRVRRAPPWDCGFPDPQPATQYTGSSFAQPLRRVFGTLVFRAVERVDLPEPGETRPARFDVRLIDPIWTALYAPLLAFVSWIADRANPLQFLTIRRYLSLMFAALVILLSAVALSR